MTRIPLLNGLRGIAILGVIFHHSFFPYILYGKGHHLTPLLILESSGWLGVNLFFFLSGFVLFLPYAERKRRFSDWKSYRSYLGHRAKRLIPLYYITTFTFLIFICAYQLNDQALYRNIADYAFATYIFRQETFFPPANWVLWSLGVEVWFSVFFPFVVLAIEKYGWKKTLLTVLIISLTVRVMGRMVLPATTRPTINWLSDSLPGRLDEFVIGMLSATLFLKRWKLARPLYQLAIGVFLVTASMTLWALWYRGHFTFAAAGLFNLPFDFGILLTVNALLTGCRPVASLICAWPLQMSGLMCYSLYLWHGQIISKYRPSAYTAPTFLGYLGLVYLVSWLSYRYIEFGAVKEWRALLPSTRKVDAAVAAPAD